jgi:hypothetical protein
LRAISLADFINTIQIWLLQCLFLKEYYKVRCRQLARITGISVKMFSPVEMRVSQEVPWKRPQSSQERSSPRQSETEGASLAGGTLHPDFTAVGFYDHFCD